MVFATRLGRQCFLLPRATSSGSPAAYFQRATELLFVRRAFTAAPSFSKPEERRDPYDRYRQKLASPEIRSELNTDSAKTMKYIQDLGPEPDFLDVMSNAVMHAAIENEKASNDEHSLGPTGRFRYKWVMAGPLEYLRSYRRYQVDDPSKQTEVVLDMDFMAADLLSMSLSVDETMLAYILRNDNEEPQILVRMIGNDQTVKLASIPKEEEFVAAEFGAVRQDKDEHSLFLLAKDSLGSPKRVFSLAIQPHLLFNLDDIDASETGTTTSANNMPSPTLLYEAPDPKAHVDVQRTQGCQYVAINARTQSSNEIHLIQHHNDNLQLVRSREDGVQYHLNAGSDDDIFVLASSSSPSGKADHLPGIKPALYQSSMKDLPLRDGFGKLLSESDGEHEIFDFDLFEKFIAYYELSTVDGTHRIRVVNRRKADDESVVPFSADVETLTPSGNMNYKADSLQFFAESPSEPFKILGYNMMTKELNPMNQSKPNPRKITKRRIFVTSKDGTKVPLSLVYMEKINDEALKKDPLTVILTGYGAYGKPVKLAFDPTLEPLLKAGFALAFAHTRGGSELGKAWHLGGRGLNKIRAIEDFIACAEVLTSGAVFKRPVELTAKGFSAGGVIIGAAVNRRPELFRNVVLTNAFLDLDATMRNPSLYLTEHEWDEYGNPLEDEEAAKSIRSICPVSNVPFGKDLPRFLLITCLDDEEVPFWNSVIYGKKIAETGKAEVYLNVESEGGHKLYTNSLDVAAVEATFIAGNGSRS